VLAEHYRIERELGRGGMATVYRARDLRHDRPVAVKVMHDGLAVALGADRFLREIRLVARLQHPHILPLFDSGRDEDGQLWFVMPYVDGESLRARLAREGALSLAETLRHLRQTADALDYAHARGIVHRDLKPENILLEGGHALLADFGIARGPGGDGAADGAARGSTTVTAAGMSLGTPHYMSPEQATAERELDGRSDVYALGCLCYEMLAGRVPFTGANALVILGQHLGSPPPPLAAVHGTLPPGIARAVTRALAKAPADRFATAGAFVAALEAAAGDARAASVVDAPLPTGARHRASRPRVLVLEFANLTRAADADWLSTGITETVSADLGKIAGVQVVGHDAATRRRLEAALQGRTVDAGVAAELGRSAGAQWVVWGAFQQVGPAIRITPHYVDTDEGTHLGGEKIDGRMDDIFALQDRIVAGLADALRIELTSGEVARIERPETAHLGAYEHYARGYRAYLRFGKESVQAAAEHFRAAIALDPDYALAHAGLGIIHGPRYIASGSRAVLDDGARLLERAIALEPSIGEAHAWLAYMQFRQNRFDAAARTARQAVEREPASDMGWYMLGSAHLCRAVVAHEPTSLARAVPPYLRAVALNTSNLPAWMALGSIYALRGQYAHAATLLDHAVRLEAGGATLAFLGARVQRAALHLGAGEPEAAARLLKEAIARYAGADHVYAESMTAYAHVVRGYLAERAGRREMAAEDFLRACEIADAHEHRITIGAHWVKGRLGLARVLHRSGALEEARAALAEGRDLFASRARFVWTWFYGATDAEVWYDLACTLATLGCENDAVRALGRAADAGWNDVTGLRRDPAFVSLRDTPEVLQLAAEGTARVSLPPPSGSGGLG
jgi:serine/threonine-protein kinase